MRFTISTNNRTDVNIGVHPEGAINGTVFEDLNLNSLFDNKETTRAGLTVYADINRNSQLDPSEPRAITGADDKYALTQVLPGLTSIRIVPPSGRSTTALDVTLGIVNKVATGQNLPLSALPGSVSGAVILDSDGNGARGLQEPGLNVLVFLHPGQDTNFIATDPRKVQRFHR